MVSNFRGSVFEPEVEKLVKATGDEELITIDKKILEMSDLVL